MNELLAYFDLRFAIQALLMGAGLVMAITAAEVLAGFRVYANTGILTWSLGRRVPLIQRNPILRKWGDFFYSEHRFRLLFGIRLVLGLGLLVCGVFAYLSWPLILGALLSSLLVLFRAGPGQDGSFQLRILILCVLFSCSVSSWDTFSFRIGLYFLSTQLVLSYVLAGIAKVRGRAWRDGSGLVGIMGTMYHGNGWGYRLLAGRIGLAKGFSWLIIVLELTFPLVLLGNAWVAIILLALTTVFHLATSFFMGLNGFFFSFVAAYPTLVFCIGELGWAEW